MKQLFLIVCFSALGLIASAQPFYDIEAFPVCYDSAGTQTSLQAYNLYVMGRNDVVHRLYIDEDGDKVVPGGGATLYDVPCSNVITADTVRTIAFESPLIAGDYVIAADEFNLVSIANEGYTTHVIEISGQSFRINAGTHWTFQTRYDHEQQEQSRNPLIRLKQGGSISENKLRVYCERYN
jgi:hypothetical protein